jgi:hypothetical protein
VEAGAVKCIYQFRNNSTYSLSDASTECSEAPLAGFYTSAVMISFKYGIKFYTTAVMTSFKYGIKFYTTAVMTSFKYSIKVHRKDQIMV